MFSGTQEYLEVLFKEYNKIGHRIDEVKQILKERPVSFNLEAYAEELSDLKKTMQDTVEDLVSLGVDKNNVRWLGLDD